MIHLLKLLIRAALWLFCSKIHIKNKHLLVKKGPLLIIANHPNSFLDAIIIAAQYKRRVYFLARGDAFNKPLHRSLLRSLNMIPVYRLREGRENLHLNEYAFKESIKLLKAGEAVLIFIEGVCINDHELQPLKKGTTRILEGVHKDGIFPTIHILGIAYNQLRGIGKIVNISIIKFDFLKSIVTAKDRVLFNNQVANLLKENIVIPKQINRFKKSILYYLQYPFYHFIAKKVAQKTIGTVFYDSVLFSILLFTYPIFLLFLFAILYLFKIPLPIILITLLSIPILSKHITE